MVKEWSISFQDDEDGAIGVFVQGNCIDTTEMGEDIIYVDGVRIQFNAYIKIIEEVKEDPLFPIPHFQA